MSGAVNLKALAETVDDEASFVAFLGALSNDRRIEEALEAAKPSSPWGPGHLGWENGTISAFLEAASAWAIASKDGLPMADYNVPKNPWTRCAQILLMGKHYE